MTIFSGTTQLSSIPYNIFSTMQKFHTSSASSRDQGKQSMPPGKSPGKPHGKSSDKLASKPIFRQLQPIDLCKCRERVEGPTISQGERLEWPLLRQKIERVFPQSSNPIVPCEWGHKVINQDSEGRTWEFYFLEIKDGMPVPTWLLRLKPSISRSFVVRPQAECLMRWRAQ